MDQSGDGRSSRLGGSSSGTDVQKRFYVSDVFAVFVFFANVFILKNVVKAALS